MADAHGEQGSDGNGQWFLRFSEDMTYGPIPFSTLTDWTADGRILAEHMVSPDGRDWIPAAMMPDLKMEWTTELKNGSVYGPFNLLAAPQLLKRGIVADGALLKHKDHDKAIPITALLKVGDVSKVSIDELLAGSGGAGPQESAPAVSPSRPRPPPLPPPTSPRLSVAPAAGAAKPQLKRVAETVAAAGVPADEVGRLKQELAAERAGHQATREKLRSKQNDLADAVELLSGRSSEQKKLVEELRVELANVHERCEALERKAAGDVEKLTAQTRAFESVRQGADAELARLRAGVEESRQESDTLRNQVDEARREADRLRAELAEERAKIGAAAAVAVQKDAELRKRADEFEGKAASLSVELESLKKELQDALETKSALASGNTETVRGLAEQIAALKKSAGELDDRLTGANELLAVEKKLHAESVSTAQARIATLEQETLELGARLEKRDAELAAQRTAGETALRGVVEKGEALAGQREELAAALKAAEAALAKADRESADVRRELEQERGRSSSAAEAASAAAKSWAEDREKLAQLVRDAEKKAAGAEERLAAVRQEASSLAAEFERKAASFSGETESLRKQHEETRRGLTARVEELEKQLAGAEAANAAGRSDAGSDVDSELAARVEAGDRRIAELTGELESTKAEVANVVTALVAAQRTGKIDADRVAALEEDARNRAESETKSAERLKELQGELTKTADALARARRELEEQKMKCASLEKSVGERSDGAVDPEVGVDLRPNEVEWSLKLDDGSVFGPARLSDLRDWAMQFRIGPDHQVSADGTNWVAAKDVPELEMEWMLSLADGTVFGPLHILAVRHLIEDGMAAANAEVESIVNGEKWVASNLLTPEMIAARTKNNQLMRELSRKDALLQAGSERIQLLRRKLVEAEARLKAFEESAEPPASEEKKAAVPDTGSIRIRPPRKTIRLNPNNLKNRVVRPS